jgi:hypothetical protein
MTKLTWCQGRGNTFHKIEAKGDEKQGKETVTCANFIHREGNFTAM